METYVIQALVLGICIGVSLMMLITIAIRTSQQKEIDTLEEINEIQNVTLNEIVSYAVNQNQKIKQIEKENKQLKEVTRVLNKIAKNEYERRSK